MAEPVLGIDLGTTNSAVAVADAEGVRVLADSEGYPLIPSVVSFHPSGEVLVGREARERRLVDASNTVYSVKRLIGRPFESSEVRRAQERFPFELAKGPTGGVMVRARGESHTLSEISAFVLRKIRTVAESSLGRACSKAVITVPANFNELQRSATKAAGRVAGIDVLRILNEPTAAALAYGYGKGSRERIAIFDLGGGTFDVTILDLSGDVFEVMATAGDTFLGGDDIDLLIAEQMADAFLRHHRYDARADAQAFERLRAAAEWAKCELSDKEEVQLRVEDLAYGDGGKALHLKFRLTRDTLEGMAQPLIARAFDVCEDAFKIANVRPSQLDNVILVGGQTRMPLVSRMVAEYFGMAPLADIDPELVVARGAAVQAQALAPSTGTAIGRVTLSQMPVRPRSVEPNEVRKDETHPLFAFEDPTIVGGGTTSVDSPHAMHGDDSFRRTLGYDDATAVQPSPLGGSSPPPVPADALARSSLRPPGAAPQGARSLPPPVPSLRPSAPPASPSRPPAAAPARAPLLLDVTPLTLGIETVDGYCEAVIGRNSAIPAEQSRVFSTAQDNQTVVRVRICQGESRRLEANQGLGEFLLVDLPRGPRGHAKVSVTFVLDANGILQVQAKDLATGRAQGIEVNLVGGLSDDEIAKLRAKQDSLFGG